MKKILLSIALAMFGLVATSNAQTIMSQTFGSPTAPPALPSTWSQSSTGTTAWHTCTGGTGCGNTWASLTDAYNVPTSAGQFVIVDDAADPNQLHDTLKSPVFDMSAYSPSSVWMSYDYFFYNATNNASGLTETCYIIGSSNGGSTWSILDSVAGNAWNNDAFNTAYVGMSTLSGSNCMIGFVYSDHGGAILGCALNNVTVFVPPANQVALTAVSPVAPSNFFQTGLGAPIGGTIYNEGYTPITSIQVIYQDGSGTPVVNTIGSLYVEPFTSYNFVCHIPCTVLSGSQTVTIHISEPGSTTSTDTMMTTTIFGADSLEYKNVLIEEFNQASCDPCAEAAPNVDSVYANNHNISNIVRYHVDWPGRDCMDSVTLAPFVQNMVNFYGVNGVPWAELDGTYEYPGASGQVAGALNSYTVQNEAASASPFKITLTPSFDATTQTYSFIANVTCFTSMPAGLVLRAALTVDTITYAANQSTESIPQTIFPQVAENMFPTASGTSMSAFTAGSTQTITGSWVKNHPWGSDYSVWSYDSTNLGQIVVWVMDNSIPYVYQSLSAIVSTTTTDTPGTTTTTITDTVLYTDSTLAVKPVQTKTGSINIYPNPASNMATVAINLVQNDNVSMQVYDMVGKLVYSMPAENRNAGTSVTNINLTNFANGDYIVRVIIGGQVLNKKLTVIR